jgi:hypothetical protein
VFGLVYIFLVAKPISIRRLCLLFVLALTLAMTLLSVLHAGHALKYGLAFATSVVLLAWAFPLSRAVYDSIRYRRLAIDALHPASDVVRWTYGVALVVVPIMAIGWLLEVTHVLVLGMLPRLMTLAALGGLALLLATSIGIGVRRKPGQRSNRQSFSTAPERCRRN